MRNLDKSALLALWMLLVTTGFVSRGNVRGQETAEHQPAGDIDLMTSTKRSISLLKDTVKNGRIEFW